VSTAVVESFADVASWSAHRPDGSPSDALAIAGGGPSRGRWRTTPTARVTASTEASGHRLDRIGPPVDLRPFTDVVLWVRADRPADGSPERPFFAEVRFGSGVMAPEADGNAWHRFIDVATRGEWQQVPLALADLAPQVRESVTTIRLTCVDATSAWTLDLDRIIAVREEMLADADAALVARLHEGVRVDGIDAPAIVAPTANPPAGPHLCLTNYDVQPALARSLGAGRRTDHTRSGFSLRPPVEPFDVYYAVEGIGPERAQVATMLDFALAQFGHTTTVESGARIVRVESVDRLRSDVPPDRPVLRLRVTTGRTPAAAPERAVPIVDVHVEVEQRV
jgi:hypothetical protein